MLYGHVTDMGGSLSSFTIWTTKYDDLIHYWKHCTNHTGNSDSESNRTQSTSCVAHVALRELEQSTSMITLWPMDGIDESPLEVKEKLCYILRFLVILEKVPLLGKCVESHADHRARVPRQRTRFTKSRRTHQKASPLLRTQLRRRDLARPWC